MDGLLDPAPGPPPGPASSPGPALDPAAAGGDEPPLPAAEDEPSEDDLVYGRMLGRKFGKYTDHEAAKQYMATLDDEDRGALDRYMKDCDDAPTRDVYAKCCGKDVANPEDKMEVGRYQKQLTDSRTKYRKLAGEHEQLKVRYAKAEAELADLRTKERYAKRRAALTERREEGYVLDIDDELSNTEDYSEDQFDRHVNTMIPERYAKVPLQMVPVDPSPPQAYVQRTKGGKVRQAGRQDHDGAPQAGRGRLVPAGAQGPGKVRGCVIRRGNPFPLPHHHFEYTKGPSMVAVTTPSIVAAGDIRPSRFITISTAANHRALEFNAGDTKVLGVSQEGTKEAPQAGSSDLAAAAGDHFQYFPGGPSTCWSWTPTGVRRGTTSSPTTTARATWPRPAMLPTPWLSKLGRAARRSACWSCRHSSCREPWPTELGRRRQRFRGEGQGGPGGRGSPAKRLRKQEPAAHRDGISRSESARELPSNALRRSQLSFSPSPCPPPPLALPMTRPPKAISIAATRWGRGDLDRSLLPVKFTSYTGQPCTQTTTETTCQATSPRSPIR